MTSMNISFEITEEDYKKENQTEEEGTDDEETVS